MPQPSPSHPATFLRQLHWLHLAALAFIVFGFRYLPLQDYPDWLYQGFVFDRLVLHGEFKECFALQPFLAPNIASTVIIASLCEIFPPELAGKIFLMASLSMMYFGIERFASIFVQKENRTAIRLMAFLFSINTIFLGGMVNYTFGLGLGFLIVAWLIRTELHLHPVLLSLLLLTCYLSHFLAFSASMLMLVVWLIWERKWPLLFKLFLALVPIGCLFLHYSLTRIVTGDAPYATTHGLDLVREILANPFRTVAFFLGFYGLSQNVVLLKAAAYSTALVLWVLTFLAFYRWPKTGPARYLLVTAGLLIVFGLLMPLELKGVVRPGERLIFPAVIIGLIAFVILWPGARLSFSVLMAFLNLGILLHVGWHSARFNEMIVNGNVPPSGEQPFMWYNGFIRFPFYRAIREKSCLSIMDSQMLTPIRRDTLPDPVTGHQ